MLSEHFGILMDYFLNSEAWQLPNRWFRLFNRRHLGMRDCHVAALLAMTKKTVRQRWIDNTKPVVPAIPLPNVLLQNNLRGESRIGCERCGLVLHALPGQLVNIPRRFAPPPSKGDF